MTVRELLSVFYDGTNIEIRKNVRDIGFCGKAGNLLKGNDPILDKTIVESYVSAMSSNTVVVTIEE